LLKETYKIPSKPQKDKSYYISKKVQIAGNNKHHKPKEQRESNNQYNFTQGGYKQKKMPLEH